MDNRELYQGLKTMEAQIQLMLTRFSELRKGVTHVLEKDSELKIENQHLRGVLEKFHHHHQKQEKRAPVTSTQEPQLPKSRQNLLKLYHEGFHICNQFFGKHRDENENCLFCNEIIFRHSHSKSK